MKNQTPDGRLTAFVRCAIVQIRQKNYKGGKGHEGI